MWPLSAYGPPPYDMAARAGRQRECVVGVTSQSTGFSGDPRKWVSKKPTKPSMGPPSSILSWHCAYGTSSVIISTPF